MSVLDKIRVFGAPIRNVPHKDNAPFLEVSELGVRFNGIAALEDINFKLSGGEKIAVVGPNGAGKSTLIKVISGVLAPTQGSVSLGGHHPHGHICIAYLPQRSEVDWSFPLTVRDVVMMGKTAKLGLLRRPKKKDWDHVYECLDLVHMTDLAKREINELSGGQQQRMFIAQALAQEAELLMMDEPFSALDIPSQDEVLAILDALVTRGVTVMVATHDLARAADSFDLVLLLNNRLLGFGSPEEVFTEPQLKSAYGGHLQLIETDAGMMVLDDTCCDD